MNTEKTVFTASATRALPVSSPPVGVAANSETGAPKVPGMVGIRIRMYRVGFGDFFLLSFPDEHGAYAHILIDCGVFKGTSQTGDIGTIERAVTHMLNDTRGDLALVVMTHRHADHISGFARCKTDFASAKVGAVWMPIWESEYEPTAVKFQAALEGAALGLAQHFTGLREPSGAEQVARRFMENALGLDGSAAAMGSNASALQLLKSGLKVTPEYYKANDVPKVPATLQARGVTCRVLGPPPVTDVDLMKLMDLTKGVGQYLAPEQSADTLPKTGISTHWEATPRGDGCLPEGIDAAAFSEWLSDRRTDAVPGGQAITEAKELMESSLSAYGPLAALTAATQLNSFLNNQSLVLHFTFKGKELLFAGDAQAGNWEKWLFASDTPDKGASGMLAPDAQKLLKGLHFYKVGHHGSSNATPRIAAETMCSGGHAFVAMCSTQAGVYGTENPADPSKGTEVPRGLLLDVLETCGGFVRSDQIPIDDLKTVPTVAQALPTPASAYLDRGEFWVDCFL